MPCPIASNTDVFVRTWLAAPNCSLVFSTKRLSPIELEDSPLKRLVEVTELKLKLLLVSRWPLAKMF